MRHRSPIALVSVALFVAACASPGTGGMTSVFDLANGQCFNDAGETIVDEVEVVDCANAHDYEIYAVDDYPAESGADYVGEEEIGTFVQTTCLDGFEEFVGMTYEESELDIYYLAPTEDSWGSGDREVLCAAYLPSDTGDPEPVEGTLEGSNR
ncbi:MAG TPA: septum formation family protein [Candidatus Limnocylindria bacterium]|nr:septum formation family protein [Candidatus Limnocylindria bacterium]